MVHTSPLHNNAKQMYMADMAWSIGTRPCEYRFHRPCSFMFLGLSFDRHLNFIRKVSYF